MILCIVEILLYVVFKSVSSVAKEKKFKIL
jgi:hypothetical protein